MNFVFLFNLRDALELAQAANRGADRRAVRRRQGPRPADLRLVARLALPDPDSLAAEREAAAPLAEVLRVGRDLQLLDALAEVRTITNGVLTHDANLNGALAHFVFFRSFPK